MLKQKKFFFSLNSCLCRLISVFDNIYFIDASRKYTVVHFSSNVNEVIRAISNLLFFSHKKTPHATKAQNTYKQTKIKNALKKHLRGKKSLIRLFAFCAFVLLLGCVFVLFVPLLCVESFCGKKIKGLKLP